MSILSTAQQSSSRHVAFAGSHDLLEDFFCVRFATANAKVMAQYLQFVLGFREIAYKGLETGAMFEACHVLRCNDIIFEVVSALHCIEPVDDFYDLDSSSSSDWEEENTRDSWDSRMNRDPWFAQMLEIPKFQAFMSNTRHSQSELQAVLNETLESAAISRFVRLHGFGVMDVAFRVSDVEQVFQQAVSNGALALQEPVMERDSHGAILMAVLGSPNTDLRHTIIQNIDYRGVYLPHYVSSASESTVETRTTSETRTTQETRTTSETRTTQETRTTSETSTTSASGVESTVDRFPEQELPPAYTPLPQEEVYESGLLRVDHCVQNFSWNQMKKNAMFYAACFGMSKFWSVDEKDVSTGKTGLNSTVMISQNGKVKMPINEPVKVKMRGQIEEFYDFHGGPGVQHIALQTEDIVQSVEYLQSRGMKFNSIQPEYYSELKQRLDSHRIRLFEDFEQLRHLNILVDFDANSRYLYRDDFYTCHYILQIFTKPIQDRPTFFFEIIQRRNHNGFGKGTFKGLFETIEREQMLRGTL